MKSIILDQILYDDGWKKVFLSNKEIRNLNLDAVVIPAFPDLAIQLLDRYAYDLLSLFGESIQNKGINFAKNYSKKPGYVISPPYN